MRALDVVQGEDAVAEGKDDLGKQFYGLNVAGKLKEQIGVSCGDKRSL